uniref:Peptidase M14 domain-containing protein n=2 Tax=Scylla olivacea TaxID=85551 RepID=A0A0P4W6G3_SCYOL
MRCYWVVLVLLVLDVVLVTSSPTPVNNYQVLAGHQIWRAEGGSEVAAVMGRLEEEGLVDILGHSIASTFRVFPGTKDSVSTSLQREGIKYHVVVPDLGRHLAEEERRVKREILSSQEETCFENDCPKPLTKRYMTYDEIEWYLRELAAKSPRVDLKSIGKTFENRNIWLVHIKPTAKEGIHAREWISEAVTLQLLYKLASDDTNLTRNIDIYSVPIANPDGYEYSRTTDRLWRKNRAIDPSVERDCPGVDLNRNWSTGYGVGASTNPCSEVYQGSAPFSELETRALKKEMTRVSSVHNLRLVMAVHSFGQKLYHPWGFTKKEAPNTPEMKKAGLAFAEAAAKGSRGRKGAQYEVTSSSELYIASGATDDWAKATLDVPYVFTLELPDKGLHGFLLPTKCIRSAAQDVWKGMNKMIPTVLNK